MSDDGEDGDDGGDGETGREPSGIEKTLIAASVGFTLLLFGYVAWQAFFVPAGGPPRVEVTETTTLQDGRVLVHIQFVNPRDVGLLVATVESDCTQPPAEVQFENVPADGRVEGTIVCPPGTDDPSVSVTSWVQA